MERLQEGNVKRREERPEKNCLIKTKVKCKMFRMSCGDSYDYNVYGAEVKLKRKTRDDLKQRNICTNIDSVIRLRQLPQC